MTRLAVIGNISIDIRNYADGKRRAATGGAALHIALAASRAGLTARPVSVIGTELMRLGSHPQLATLDLSGVTALPGPSATFTLSYDHQGELVELSAGYGVSALLTDHALRHLSNQQDDAYHICCRRPLDIARVLPAIASRPFSLDFVVSSASLLVGAALPYLPRASAVFVNLAEYRILASQIPVEDLATVVVSDGPRAVRLFHHGMQVEMTMPPATTPAELAGAGDTLTGSFLALRAIGMNDPSALRKAVEAASTHTTRPAIPLPATE